ncbi:hypothetical protein AAAV51_00890 [Agathobaculum butyriciproducens]|uniref:Uncharacterized protein n=1 Tax=Agathobaculum butyriciproducens TaxID=1628085 RepID=A0AAW4VZB0_9FIRM|nr:hypothetical protein [Agathobaculum butyriciproducens]
MQDFMRFADRNVMQTGIFYHTAGFVTAANRLPQLFRDVHSAFYDASRYNACNDKTNHTDTPPLWF